MEQGARLATCVGRIPATARRVESHLGGRSPVPYLPDRAIDRRGPAYVLGDGIPDFRSHVRYRTIGRASHGALSDAYESEFRYQNLFESSPVGIGVADMTGALLACNKAILEPGGYTPEDIVALGNNVGVLYYDPVERDTVLAEFARDGRVQDREVRYKRKDGGWYMASLNLVPIAFRGQPCILAIVMDVTKRTEAEAALRASENFLRLSQSIGRIGSWEWNLATNHARWSTEMYRLHGIEPEGFNNTPEDYTRFVHVDDRAKVEQAIA